MSKKLIAGAGAVAAFAVALAPLATFAAETTNQAAGEHSLEINVNSMCSLVSSTTGMTGAWTGTVDGTSATQIELAGGTSNQIKFNCNEGSKVEIYAEASDLENADVADKSILATSVHATYAGIGTMALDWTENKAFTGNRDKIAHGTVAASDRSGDGFGIEVTNYKVDIAANQEAGNYSGTVTYTFDNIAYDKN